MLDSFPSILQPPEELIQFFSWQADQNLAEISEFDGDWYGRLDPSQVGWSMCTSPVDVRYSKTWTDSDDPSDYNRLAAFCRTGGDGSYAALWLDDDGTTKIVHLGSGSGSTMMGVLATDVVDFLRLLAIGYDELCWPENHNQTPDEVFDRYMRDDAEFIRPPQPEELRKWVESNFGVLVPDKASDIIAELPDVADDDSDDPFWLWDHSFPKWQQ
jgi:hypothetical protein